MIALSTRYMDNPLVSFVVPCYNYGEYLADCLKSILAQRGSQDFEVLVIDDASTDRTAEVLSAFSDPRLRTWRHEVNQGHIATLNEGLDQARGAFIARIDADDRYRPDFLHFVLTTFREHPQVGFVYGDAALIDASGRITAEQSDQWHGGRDFEGNELLLFLQQHSVCAPTLIARRDVWRRVLPIPVEAVVDDWYYSVMMAREVDGYYLHHVLADYRVHSRNHHRLSLHDGSAEASILWVLNRVFRSQEASATLENEKARRRRVIYSTQYLSLADKYFGAGMHEDARRCYARAIAHKPACVLRRGVLRRLAASMLAPGFYQRARSLVRTVVTR